ncbi:5-formyltetrahydrofolate cyclo-ligase [Sphingomonas sp. BIUV-7]|uniref:5-formyltetrahydrofolate cyclo-ligase n=1 Tax=Sphingomonas natans TaxID=3063330 RepID=A0ABT8YAZ1_9SPHN|nr:5-formyltetrahydrofolate cyclo-ligase [Sphingomonas sp. BIUV-7]MDO6415503.1 5-formyltetrahydrofolate cyclo-ligase [Sphingomonas sp. BIUV-7]
MAVPPPFSPPDGIAPHPDKPALRDVLRARRGEHVVRLGEAGARAAAESAAALLLPHIPPTAMVALYLAFHEELDPEPLANILAARGQRLALPALYDSVTMDFRVWQPGDPLERGPFRLRQPPAAAAIVSPDVIVMPMVGFDRHGGRIGQGKSHYDRALVRYPGAHRMGFAWSVQEVPDRLPHDPWDMALHAVVTEREWIPMPDTPA